MSALPKYAIDVRGVQVHTGKEPSHMVGDTLHFKDGTSCSPKTRNNLGTQDITFVEPDSNAYLTPQTVTSPVIFVTYDADGYMCTVHGGSKFQSKIGDPRGNRGIVIDHNTTTNNTFD